MKYKPEFVVEEEDKALEQLGVKKIIKKKNVSNRESFALSLSSLLGSTFIFRIERHFNTFTKIRGRLLHC